MISEGPREGKKQCEKLPGRLRKADPAWEREAEQAWPASPAAGPAAGPLTRRAFRSPRSQRAAPTPAALPAAAREGRGGVGAAREDGGGAVPRPVGAAEKVLQGHSDEGPR